MPSLTETLSTAGIAAFGLGMPTLSPAWTDTTTPSEGSDGLSLSLGAGNWICPAAGELRPAPTAARLAVTLVLGDGSAAAAPGMLLTLFPHVYLRLARLYAQVLETNASARPERALGLPTRPVPRYFYYAGSTVGSYGNVEPGDSLGVAGTMTIHDENGFPIDPVATAAIFVALMNAHHPLQEREPTAVFDANPQVKTIAGIAGTTATVRLRLSDHAGAPHDGTHLTGVTAVASASGVFKLDGASGGSDLTGTVGKEAPTATTGSFPEDIARVLKLGLGTTGRLASSVAFPAIASGVTLSRDFFSLRVIDLRKYLLGTPDTAWDAVQVEPQPAVRIHEPLDLLADGNNVLGAAAAAITGASTEAIVVAQTIDGSFAAPTTLGPGAHWPNFPAPSGTVALPGALPINLGRQFVPTAAFFDDGDASTANVDVVLSLNGLPANAAVRVYNRRFVADAREGRGDGAGGVASAAGTLTLRLLDPLGLRRPGLPESSVTIPAHATLHCDVVIVKRTGEARIYGDVIVPIDASPTTTAPPPGAPNPFGTAARRGISNAGVLGLRPMGASTNPPPSDPLSAALTFIGEGNPRNAPRLPTMARRDLLVAGLAAGTGGAWRSVIAGGRLAPEMHSADPRLGAPGGAGGRETQVVGVSTQNARLAYDVARTAFRGATNIVTRLEELAKAQWAEPAQPAELGPTAVPTSSAGTFAGAVLQTIAAGTESPELSVFRDFLDLSAIPATFDELVNWLKTTLTNATNAIPATVPRRSDVITKLNELIAKLDELMDDATVNESTKERLYNEMRRELMSACFGRRDVQWALQDAIAGARRFVYVESPGFTATARQYTGAETRPAFAVDLVAALAARLNAVSGLRVLLCTPKQPDYGPGYEPFASGEVVERLSAIEGLPTATSAEPRENRVVAFHPIGFPGRPSRLESMVVVVDDIWALVGSSTWRRRGVTFDGGSDLVFTDTNLVNGISPAIQEFRRRLLTARLGVTPPELTPPPAIPDPRWVRLADGAEAATVVREQLRAGGLGQIERYWRGDEPGFAPPPPLAKKYRDPDAEDSDYDLVGTLALATLATLNSF